MAKRAKLVSVKRVAVAKRQAKRLPSVADAARNADRRARYAQKRDERLFAEKMTADRRSLSDMALEISHGMKTYTPDMIEGLRGVSALRRNVEAGLANIASKEDEMARVVSATTGPAKRWPVETDQSPPTETRAPITIQVSELRRRLYDVAEQQARILNALRLHSVNVTVSPTEPPEPSAHIQNDLESLFESMKRLEDLTDTIISTI